MKTQLQFFVITTALLLSSNVLSAQNSQPDLLRVVADRIIAETTYKLTDIKTNESYSDFSNLPNGSRFKINPYNEWKYWNGVLGVAFFKMTDALNDPEYGKYAEANLQFIFDHYGLFKKMTEEKKLKGMEQLYRNTMLDDCGAMGAFAAMGYKNNNSRKDYLSYLKSTAEYMLNKEIKLDDGTFARNLPYSKTMWLDDLYMSVPFLARYGSISGEAKYFDFAARQVELFTKYLFDEKTGLYFHCYYDSLKQTGSAHWGRANGWSIVAQADLLEFLPKDHPKRETLLKIFRQQIVGFSRYQSESGLWHQLLDKSDSYLETSCTAMFTYAVAKGINNGWLDAAYTDVALNGWEGIKSMITPDGLVKNICQGTITNTSIVYYYKREIPLNDIHGLGALLLAGLEVSQLKTITKKSK